MEYDLVMFPTLHARVPVSPLPLNNCLTQKHHEKVAARTRCRVVITINHRAEMDAETVPKLCNQVFRCDNKTTMLHLPISFSLTWRDF